MINVNPTHKNGIKKNSTCSKRKPAQKNIDAIPIE